jgi:hypothetical protein
MKGCIYIGFSRHWVDVVCCAYNLHTGSQMYCPHLFQSHCAIQKSAFTILIQAKNRILTLI